MSFRIGTRGNGTPTNNPAELSAGQLAETYNTGRRRDRTRIQKDVNRRNPAQQVKFQEKTSCLSYLSEEEKDMCHEQLPKLYALLFDTPRYRRMELRANMGRDNFMKTMQQLVSREIVDETRLQSIMNYFMH